MRTKRGAYTTQMRDMHNHTFLQSLHSFQNLWVGRFAKGNDHTALIYRLDQLILPDDPAFAPELEISLAPPSLDFELSLHAASWDATSLLPATSSEKGAPRTPQKRKVMLTKDGQLTTELALAAPSSMADALAAGRRDLLGSALRDTHERLASGRHDGVGVGDGDDGFLPDAGFEFDIDGNLIDLSSDGAVLQGSDAALSAQVRREHEEARHAAEIASTGMVV